MKLIIIIAVVVIALPGGLALAGLALDRETVKTHSISDQVREIVVKSDNGDVDLVRAGTTVLVRETRHYVVNEPALERELSAGVLTLEADCGGFFFDCSTDLRVTVPAGAKVTVEVDSGDVDADAIDVRDVHAQSDAGDVDLELTGSQALVWAHTDSGDVDVQTPGARAVDAQTDSGDVNVDARGAARRVIARTDSGDVDVTVPAGEYAVDTETDSGDVDIERAISRNDRADRSIDARTDSGDVTLNAG